MKKTMPDREKVITALQHCIEKPCHTNCPYFDLKDESQAYCLFRKIMPDALALLKEQEARVLTKDEVLATPEGTVVWMEEESESGTYIQPIVSTGNGFLGNFYIGVGTYGIDSEKRRFWTSRPNEQVRRDTPWEN